MSFKNRIVITGMGAVSPIGADVESSWKALLEGKSGIRSVKDQHPLFADTKSHYAAPALPFECPSGIFTEKEQSRTSRLTHMNMTSISQAVADSEIDFENNPQYGEKACCIVGFGLNEIDPLMEQWNTFKEAPKSINSSLVLSICPNISPGYASIKYNLKGPNYVLSAACATGSLVIAETIRYMQETNAPVGVAASSDSSIHPLIFQGFLQIRGPLS